MRDGGGRGREESERQGKKGERGAGKGRREGDRERKERGEQGKEERGGQALNRLPLLYPFHPHAQQAQHSTAHTVSSPPAAQ